MDLIEHRQVTSKDFKRHPWESARFKVLNFFIRKFRLSKNYILDVGSGDAFICKQLSEKYPEIKINATDVNYDDEFMLKHLDPCIRYTRSLNDIDEGKINLVLLMDVIEHIEKPETLIREIRNLKNVDASTRFFITVPAYQSLFTEHDVFLGHYRRYNRNNLISLMKSEGFKIEESGYFFFSLMIIRFFQKHYGQRSFKALHNWKGNMRKTFFVESFLWIDFKISWYLSRLGIRLPGLSCYCLCKPLL